VARPDSPRVFLLDEPTTGLHLRDVEVLVRLLRRLIDAGHTIVVVEHHLELVRAADWVVDLGPGPGEEGGRLVAEGPPEAVARSAGPTGRYLAERFRGRTGRPGRGRTAGRPGPGRISGRSDV
jgi:excinuclease ABC subunit A